MQVGIFAPTIAYEGCTVDSPMITVQILILLLTVIAAVSVAALRLKIPPAILLVISGVVLALVPGLPTVNLAPDFVLLFVLPPIIYASAVEISWSAFKFNLRPISLLAVGCVFFTTTLTASVSHWFSASHGRLASCWVPLSPLRTPSHRWPLRDACSCRNDCC